MQHSIVVQLFQAKMPKENARSYSFNNPTRKVQCGSRLRQMTANFDDPQATFYLLKEKEKDLELAATVGLRLLKTNDDLRVSIDSLNEELSRSSEVINQLRYDIKIKERLISQLNEEQYYCDVLDETERLAGSYSTNTSGRVDESIAQIKNWATKIKKLEAENEKLKNEASLLRGQTKQVEDKERKLMKSCVHKMSKTNTKLETANMQIAKRIEECNQYKQEIKDLLSHISELKQGMKSLESENVLLKEKLNEGIKAYSVLQKQIGELQSSYKESLQYLDRSREETKKWQLAYTQSCNSSSMPAVEIIPSMPPSPTVRGCEDDEDDMDSSLRRRLRRPRRSMQSNSVRNREESLKAQLEFTSDVNYHCKASNHILDRSTDSGVQSDTESVVNHEFTTYFVKPSNEIPMKKVILVKQSEGSKVLKQWRELNSSNLESNNCVFTRWNFSTRKCPRQGLP
ncbi:hypothetical protein ACOME3_006133 [Neoechinorhynchus agilis]